ncbi:MAG: ABC transporter ATP-binding protein, partial [Thermoanaerobaculia bacterium]
LRKSYRGVLRRTRVLEGVDLTVGSGEIVGLIGPNGAGKTTLLFCLMSFLRPDGGTIAFDGRPPDDLTIRRRTGYGPERLGFERSVSGRRFLLYMGRLGGLRGPDLTRRVGEILERFGMTAAADRRMGNYSRGMLQRIALAQAVLHRPDFLLLDEPTSGIDPIGLILVREVLEEERARGAAILINSHQLAELERLCDRALFLDRGRIARDARLRGGDSLEIVLDFQDRPGATEHVQALGWTVDGTHAWRAIESEDDINALLLALIDRGIVVTGLRRRTAELERFFRGGNA